jgi:hypothetical protein
MEIMNWVRTQWDRAVAIGLVLLGLLALLLGWIGVSGTPHVAAQLPYIISGGLLGIFLLGASAVMWISADLRDEWSEIHQARRLLQERKSEWELLTQRLDAMQSSADAAAEPPTAARARANGAARKSRSSSSRAQA